MLWAANWLLPQSGDSERRIFLSVIRHKKPLIQIIRKTLNICPDNCPSQYYSTIYCNSIVFLKGHMSALCVSKAQQMHQMYQHICLTMSNKVQFDTRRPTKCLCVFAFQLFCSFSGNLFGFKWSFSPVSLFLLWDVSCFILFHHIRFRLSLLLVKTHFLVLLLHNKSL